MEPQKQSGTKNAQNADLSVENLQETENRATFAQRPARTEEEMLRRKEGDRKYVDPMSDYGFKDKTEEDCTTNLERWIYNLIIMNSTTKPLAFQDIMPVFKEVASAAELASMSEEEYRRYMNSLDRYRTAVACYDYAYEEGMAKGEAKGRSEERAEATRDHAIAMKKNGASTDFIVKCLNMSIEEVEALPTE